MISKKYYFDLQIHTTRYSPCSKLPPEKLIDQAYRRKLHGFVITEHDHCWSEEEIAALKAESKHGKDMVVLAGCEVRTSFDNRFTGDLLLFGVPGPPESPCTIGQACRYAREHGGLAIAPHPYAKGQGIGDEVYRANIAALEVRNNRYPHDFPMEGRSQKAWEGLDLAGVASSDAHSLDEVGMACTVFPGPVRNMEDLLHMIRKRSCKPRFRPAPFRWWPF
ncbi:MAG: PHP-associated domain-containing protein [Candidatus Sumerlaeia bacterium]